MTCINKVGRIAGTVTSHLDVSEHTVPSIRKKARALVVLLASFKNNCPLK